MDRFARTVVTGQRIGRGVVTNSEIRVMEGSKSRRGARLLCDCGTFYETAIHNLIPQSSGKISTRSCGCLYKNTRPMAGEGKIHGLNKHRLYSTWINMINRCHNPHNTSYPRYGQRGIAVCESWHDVTKFISYIEANLGSKPEGKTLDRIDNSGNYEPGNVRWATSQEQRFNSRRWTRNTSGHIGVRERSGRWICRVGETWIGTFDDFQSAVNAYHDQIDWHFSSCASPCCDEYIGRQNQLSRLSTKDLSSLREPPEGVAV